MNFVFDRIPKLKRRRSVFENGEKLIVASFIFLAFVYTSSGSIIVRMSSILKNDMRKTKSYRIAIKNGGKEDGDEERGK